MATRTFLALPLDEALCRHLADVQRQLDTVGAKVRWTAPEQLHVTVKVLCDVEDEDLADVCQVAAAVAAEIEPFDFRVARLICSPPAGYLRMVWVGIEEATGRMEELHQKLDMVFADMGYKAEHRGFHPHLTLGRVKSSLRILQLRQAIEAMGDTEFGEQGADDLIVFASQRHKGGPEHTVLSTAELGK
jgi:2'-5' RNA ligase